VHIKADAAYVEKVLGPPRYLPDLAERTSTPGVATGLAWTPAGGDVLFIEATQMPGKGSVVITGNLKAVMQESANAAVSFVRSHAKALGLDPEFLRTIDLHVHVPKGGTPKDGPSAGVTMYSAVASLLVHCAVKRDVAMTGEITLRGSVLPVGGIKEKLLAAHRAGIKTVLIHLIKRVAEILPLVLEPPTTPPASAETPSVPPAEQAAP
jgi:ATP-dependent Lon protease